MMRFLHDSFVMPQPWEHRGIAPRWEVRAAVAWNYMIVALMLALVGYVIARLIG